MATLGVFSAIGGGIRSAGFTWFTNKIGLVQNIAGTVPPSLKGAFLFEAINRSVAYGSSKLNERVKDDLLPDASSLKSGADMLQFAFALASRYAVARFCNTFFGSNITNRFVHLYTASDVIFRASGYHMLQYTAPAFFTAYFARYILSIVVMTPTFRNAFYFTATSSMISSSLALTSQRARVHLERRLGLTDQKVVFVFKVMFTAAYIFAIAKVAERFNNDLQLKIPVTFLRFFQVVTALMLWADAFRELSEVEQFILMGDSDKTIGQGIIGFFAFPIYVNQQRDSDASSMFASIIQRLNASGNNQDKKIATMVQTIEDYGDSKDFVALWNDLTSEGLSKPFSDLGKEVQNCLSSAIDHVAWGGITANPQSLDEAIDQFKLLSIPIYDILYTMFVKTSIEGADFIMDEVLKDASQQTKDALEIMDAGRNTTLFIVTKGIAIYVVGSKKEEELPAFFSDETNQVIQRLRNSFEVDGNTDRAVYEEILQELNAASTSTEGEEDFFEFGAGFAQGSEQSEALNALKGLGAGELNNVFVKNCCRIATRRLGEIPEFQPRPIARRHSQEDIQLPHEGLGERLPRRGSFSDFSTPEV